MNTHIHKYIHILILKRFPLNCPSASHPQHEKKKKSHNIHNTAAEKIQIKRIIIKKAK